jgi:hypothetical protein
MVGPVDPSNSRVIPLPAGKSAGDAGPSQRAGAGAPEGGSGGDVVAPSLIDQIDQAQPGFDPFAVAERVGRALARSDLSIGNARPASVAALQR